MHDEREDSPAAAARSSESPADQAMERYADGDDAAFATLYDELEPPLRRFAASHTGSDAAADDVIQQTLLQIHLSRHRFIRGAAVLPWAFAIALNAIRDTLRRNSRFEPGAQAGEEEPSALLPDEALDAKRRERAMAEALRSVPEKLREAFLLVNVEGLSVADAAAILGITPANVKVRAFRARQLLIKADALREAGSAPRSPPRDRR